MDTDRRKFLKILLISGGTVIAGKVLGPLFSILFENSSSKKETNSSSSVFRVVENKQQLSIYDNSGEEIFQIDKGA